MKIILICFISFSICINLNAQSDCDCYERLKNLSDYFTAEKDYPEANKLLLKALSHKDKENWDKLDYKALGLSFSKIKDYKNCEKYLSKAISVGYSLASIKRIKELELFKQTPYWDQLVLKSDSLKKLYQANLNLEYRLALEDISGSDQAIRSFMEVSDSMFTFVDSTNYFRLKELISKYGFPNQSQHGFNDVEVFHFFLHASMYSEVMYKDILNVLNAAQQECLVSSKRIAIIQDRRAVWKDEKLQSLGVWNNWDDKEKYSQIQNLKTVDSLRFGYNLLRLNEQSKIDNRKLPDEYNKSKYPQDYFCKYKFVE